MNILMALLCSISLFTGAALADPIQTIQLRHRPADEIMPVIKPLLGPDDSLTGQGYQLFIRTSEKNFEQLKQMVSKLDAAAKMLLISVFQGNDRELRALGVSGNFQYQDSNAKVGLGSSDKSAKRGADVKYSTRNASAGAHSFSTRGRLSDNPIHQLRISEGSEGYIETGESIPYFSGSYWRGGRHGIVETGVDYKDINTGFYVLPRVHGEQVTMDVSPYKQSQSRKRGGDIETQSAGTRITAELGQWLPIGGVSGQTQRSSTRVGSYESTQSRDNASIWIKADLVQ
jgi:type II secretory pathway component GspD/PulD (secretin)